MADTDKNALEFLQEARDRYSYALQFDALDRAEAIEDADFVAGGLKQWRKEDIAARSDPEYPRPIITENRLPTFVQQVANDGRQSKPAIKCTALDGGDKATAEYFQGRIRHIEYDSDADIAYDTSREHQIICGRGYYKVVTEYEPTSFKQRLRVVRVENPFSVLFDPSAKEYDRSDADWCFVTTLFSKDAYERKFGKHHEAAQWLEAPGNESPAKDWVGVGDGKQIQVAEYWVKKYAKKTLLAFPTGHIILSDDPAAKMLLANGIQPDQSREVDQATVCQYIIDGVEILDETEWIGSYIPVIPVWGREQVVDGRRRTFSLIRNAKDPQRLLNLTVSSIAEFTAMMPKAPYMAADGQISGYEQEWAEINHVPRAVVRYKPIAIGGHAVAPPQRIMQEPPIQALLMQYSQSVDAIKASMGIFDASLGAKSNEQSGIAIERRKTEGDNANFHFHDNEARSRRHLGRILIELIPKLDEGQKTVPVRSEDGKTDIVPLGQPFAHPKTGEQVTIDPNSGNYGVAVSTGPSYTSARREAFDTYSQIATADPSFMQRAGDILFRNLDSPGSEDIAERYEKTLPPGLAPQKQDQQAQAGMMQQKMAMLSEQHQALVDQVEQMSEELKTKRFEMDSKERIARMQIESAERIEAARLGTSADIAALREDIRRTMHSSSLEHQAGMKAADQDHQANMQAANQSHASDMKMSDQQHQADMTQLQMQDEPAENASSEGE